MNPQMDRDLERLSAYIDNELPPAEKAALEARLAREPQLKAGLDDLRQTVRALRALPAIKPPRSFTLTPEQVGARARRGPLFPALRLAAALSTLLLVVTVARDLTTSGGLGASATSNVAVVSSTAPVVFAPHAAAAMTPTPETSVEAYSASAPASTGTPVTDIAVTPLVRINTLQPSATPGPTLKGAAPSETAVASVSGGGDSGPNTNLAAASNTPEATAVGVAALPPAATDTVIPGPAPVLQTPTPAPLSSLRVVEIVLAVLALVLAGATWLTRRG